MSGGSEAPAILVERVSKRYGSFAAVDRLDLTVRRGEVFCLFGPNGSGKTTLLRMLTGYISPSAGRITVAGHDVVRDGLAARREIGYVPETVPLYGHMRVGEFLCFMARLRGVAADAVEAAVERVVNLLALSEVVRKPVHVLSRGYRQRTALAQALQPFARSTTRWSRSLSPIGSATQQPDHPGLLRAGPPPCRAAGRRRSNPVPVTAGTLKVGTSCSTDSSPLVAQPARWFGAGWPCFVTDIRPLEVSPYKIGVADYDFYGNFRII